jgi:hypothetical protein
MSRKTKLEEYEKKNAKWREASSDIYDILTKIDTTLNKFSESEKKTTRYQSLVQTLFNHVDHALGDIHKNFIKDNTDKHTKQKNYSVGRITLITAIITAGGTVLVSLVEKLPELLKALFGG